MLRLILIVAIAGGLGVMTFWPTFLARGARASEAARVVRLDVAIHSVDS
jgi:hypothetical protein